ncbi:MAG TPA: hypothetical protein VFX25_16010 [Streptosporangiaceae bacterium]|nr:hypothetical protein [Streptosporangiaceae bacterium]
MGLTGLLARAGAVRPHVLVAAMPGGAAVRLAAEDQLRRRGWPAALSPADADVLLVAGAPAADIATAVEATWAAIPAPRVRALVTSPGEIAAALDAARAGLATGTRQWLPAGEGSVQPDGHGSGADGPGGSHDAHGTAGHHDMDDMDIEMPAGLPMAERGEDRDGLKLDQLHVRLGPVLPDWPAGLVVRLTLQGDVVQHAETAVTGLAGAGSFWTEPWRRAAAGEPVTTGVAARRRAGAHLDSLGRLLGLADWDDAAAAARRLRDDTLGGTPASVLAPAVRRLAVRVARSRVLAWSTRGAGVLRPGEAAAAGVTGPARRAGGDVTDRYRAWCGELAGLPAAFDDGSRLDPAALEPPRGRLDGTQPPSASLLAVLPQLLTGAEFAAARLTIASLDPDLDELSAHVGAGRDR